MKKLVAMMMVAVLGLAVVGCGKKADDTKITMGTNAEFEPFEYMSGNEVVGFDVEISKLIAEAVGKELVVENMGFDALIPALENKKIDFVAAGMTVTEERAKQVDFTDAYYNSTQVIIVAEDGSAVASAEDLKGKTIGVQIGTTGEALAKDIEGTNIESYQAGYAAVMSLQNGKLDAVILDQEPASKLVETTEGVKILDEALSKEEYAIALPKGNEELLKQINETLKKIKEDGTYDKLLAEFGLDK